MLLFLQAKVIDSENNIVPVNTPGELCFRGYLVMQGYWDDVEKTQEAIDSHGWFHSGYDTAVDVICKLDGCDMQYFMLVLELVRRLSLLVYYSTKKRQHFLTY